MSGTDTERAMAEGLERTSVGGSGGVAGTVAEVPARDRAGRPAGPGGQVPEDGDEAAAVSPAANGAAPGQRTGQPGTGQPGTGQPGTGQPGTGQPGTGAPTAARPRTWRRGWRRSQPAAAATAPVPAPSQIIQGPEIDLASNDPLVGYLLSAAGAVDIRGLELDSPALAAMKEAGVVLTVPLISSGSLIGLISLGPRLSERDYSSEDRRLLDALAGQAAPAMRVGQLVREQQAEARAPGADRAGAEGRAADPAAVPAQELPELPGWQVAAFYRPARTVGGDFYDFIPLPDGRVMLVIGDVTDKGVPAALVMASTHALLRAAAPRLIEPGAVLAQVNDLLCADIPAHMFVTCLALVLDPLSGKVEYANAGHDVPYVRTADGVAELRARGMPLGLMPGMAYEEKTFQFQPGDCALLHSDGLAEAHGADREMFGFPRVADAGRPRAVR